MLLESWDRVCGSMIDSAHGHARKVERVRCGPWYRNGEQYCVGAVWTLRGLLPIGETCIARDMWLECATPPARRVGRAWYTTTTRIPT